MDFSKSRRIIEKWMSKIKPLYGEKTTTLKIIGIIFILISFTSLIIGWDFNLYSPEFYEEVIPLEVEPATIIEVEDLTAYMIINYTSNIGAFIASGKYPVDVNIRVRLNEEYTERFNEEKLKIIEVKFRNSRNYPLIKENESGKYKDGKCINFEYDSNTNFFYSNCTIVYYSPKEQEIQIILIDYEEQVRLTPNIPVFKSVLHISPPEVGLQMENNKIILALTLVLMGFSLISLSKK